MGNLRLTTQEEKIFMAGYLALQSVWEDNKDFFDMIIKESSDGIRSTQVCALLALEILKLRIEK